MNFLTKSRGLPRLRIDGTGHSSSRLLRSDIPQSESEGRACPELPDLAWNSQTSFSQTSATTRVKKRQQIFNESGGSPGKKNGRIFLGIFLLHLLCRMTRQKSLQIPLNLSLSVLWLKYQDFISASFWGLRGPADPM